MTDNDIRALYGLKYNPFLPALPPKPCGCCPGRKPSPTALETMASQGGFALITGDPGQAKAKPCNGSPNA